LIFANLPGFFDFKALLVKRSMIVDDNGSALQFDHQLPCTIIDYQLLLILGLFIHDHVSASVQGNAFNLKWSTIIRSVLPNALVCLNCLPHVNSSASVPLKVGGELNGLHHLEFLRGNFQTN